MEKNFVVAHLSMTAYSAGACLSGRQSRMATTCHDAASRSCHARAAALKAARGHGREPPSGLKPCAPPPLSERLLLCFSMLLSSSRHLASHVAPLSVVEAVAEPVRSLVSPLPRLLREPLRCAERSAVVLLPLMLHHLIVFFSPLHAGSAAPTFEAKPRRHSLVTRPPELRHCHPSLGEQRATTTVVPPTPATRCYLVYSPHADRH
jgi:hypothetical protein